MKPFAQFFANITKTVSASGVQFALTLCTTPIMTRLFEPAAYAMFGIVNTAAVVMVGIGLLSLPNAYCAEKDAATRLQMARAMLVLLAGLILLATLGAALLGSTGNAAIGVSISSTTLVLLPVLVCTYGLRQIFMNMAIQRANFTRLSLAQIVEPTCSRGGSIVLGAGFGGHAAFILFSVAIGHLSAISILKKTRPAQLLANLPLAHYLADTRLVLRRFSDFVFYNTVAQQAQPAVMLAMQAGIAAFFSAHLAGEYVLATSILTLPATMVALATAPVVYHHFIDTETQAPTRLSRHYAKITALYLLAGTCLLAPLYFFGGPLFTFAFGKMWQHAGMIAGTLSLAYIGVFAVTGVQSILMVTRRLKLQFVLEFTTNLMLVIGAFFCFKNLAFDEAIFYLSLIWLFRSTVILCACFYAATAHPRRALLETA